MFFFFRFGHFSVGVIYRAYSRKYLLDAISHVVFQFIVTNLEKFGISLGRQRVKPIGVGLISSFSLCRMKKLANSNQGMETWNPRIIR